MSKIIPLTRGKVATVDDEDYETLVSKSWHAVCCLGNYWFAKTCIWSPKERIDISMSRYIMNPPLGMVVDHKNHDTLDNRRHNLRICTNSENSYNQKKYTVPTSSIYKGVCFLSKQGKWLAQIHSKSFGTRFLGLFKNQEDAARAYDAAALALFGEFAHRNIDAHPDLGTTLLPEIKYFSLGIKKEKL